MKELELREALKVMDDEIAVKRGEIEDAHLDLKHLAEKRSAWAKRNCPHERTFERSVMGREIEKRCSLCNEEIY